MHHVKVGPISLSFNHEANQKWSHIFCGIFQIRTAKIRKTFTSFIAFSPDSMHRLIKSMNFYSLIFNQSLPLHPHSPQTHDTHFGFTQSTAQIRSGFIWFFFAILHLISFCRRLWRPLQKLAAPNTHRQTTCTHLAESLPHDDWDDCTLPIFFWGIGNHPRAIAIATRNWLTRISPTYSGCEPRNVGRC